MTESTRDRLNDLLKANGQPAYGVYYRAVEYRLKRAEAAPDPMAMLLWIKAAEAVRP